MNKDNTFVFIFCEYHLSYDNDKCIPHVSSSSPSEHVALPSHKSSKAIQLLPSLHGNVSLHSIRSGEKNHTQWDHINNRLVPYMYALDHASIIQFPIQFPIQLCMISDEKLR